MLTFYFLHVGSTWLVAFSSCCYAFLHNGMYFLPLTVSQHKHFLPKVIFVRCSVIVKRNANRKIHYLISLSAIHKLSPRTVPPLYHGQILPIFPPMLGLLGQTWADAHSSETRRARTCSCLLYPELGLLHTIQ